jgi:chromosome segregation protein
VSAPRLVSLEIEAFRGFAQRQLIDLDADVVVIRGDNGTGKTSVIDALLWVATGNLAHLTERVKGLRRVDDPIANRYVPPPARVGLSVAAGGDTWLFERTGSHTKNSLLALRNDEPVENAERAFAAVFGQADDESLHRAIRSWGVLRQDAVRAALEAGGTLHERLSAVVGLEQVNSFTAAADATLKDLTRARASARQVLADLQAQEKEAQQRLADVQLQSADESGRRALVERSASALIASLPPGLSVPKEEMVSSTSALATLGTEVSELAEAAQVAAAHYEQLVSARSLVTVSTTELQAELSVVQAQIEGAFRSAPRMVQLAEAAIDLLGDHCPVCGQPIDERSVRDHLTEALRASQESIAAVNTAREAAAALEARIADARAADSRTQSATDATAAAVAALRAKVDAASRIRIDGEWIRPERSAGLAAALENLREELRGLYAEAGRDPSEIVARAARTASELTTRLGDAQAKLADLEDRCSRASTLSRLAREASERLVERALRRLEPTFAEVFDRLAPHPTFTQLRARQDIYYGRNQVVPEVFDPERRVSANPLLVYSEGQLNVVALSYFLGLSLNARDGALPFIVLDDPLQSMDVVSVLGFADLCRRVREQRQLLVTTHDRRFADVLVRKLAPREAGVTTTIHEFEGWTREGPVLHSRDVPVAEVASLLDRLAS